jgi:histidinol-phosphatase (PHP family)
MSNLTASQEFLSMDGRFCLSDDSHGIDQVGAKYHEILKYVQNQGIQKLHYLELAPVGMDGGLDLRFPRTLVKCCSLEVVKEMEYWKR